MALRGKGSTTISDNSTIYTDDFLDIYGEDMTDCETMLIACSDQPQSLANRMPSIQVSLITDAMISWVKESDVTRVSTKK